MLRSINELNGYPIEGSEGKLGKTKNFLFDDQKWGVRYLVVDTGGWLRERKVLISPRNLTSPDYSKHFPVKLTRAQLEGGPTLEDSAPVSKKYEDEYARYHQHAPYWNGSGLWGAGAYPHAEITPSPPSPAAKKDHEKVLTKIEDWHLRSSNEVIGYNIAATDGEIGHVEDVILDTRSWRIRYFVINTRNWLPGRKLLVDVDWIQGISWQTADVVVEMTKAQIKDSPQFDPREAVNRGYEEQLYDYYGRPRYW